MSEKDDALIDVLLDVAMYVASEKHSDIQVSVFADLKWRLVMGQLKPELMRAFIFGAAWAQLGRPVDNYDQFFKDMCKSIDKAKNAIDKIEDENANS